MKTNNQTTPPFYESVFQDRPKDELKAKKANRDFGNTN